ncbi:L-fucose/L-arabinose isomerase family protein [Paludibaculum fermentans]|uniref:L-fucose/L-arabinose isomerase family protein n=1 Tax=Paludibaculum fermentans TaxID=1473598 RepID=A0A7S7NPD1_PALFE|nr:L-fucose/L-arabinose isomerase family protein [Paludibaculum fermentans]QOY87332.1 L-fucose/L-arabinose isomerase family protein [Paludibaculum fermentans]
MSIDPSGLAPAKIDAAQSRGRVGVFGIGLAAYWPQFPGLRERLCGYQAEVEAHVAGLGLEVVSAGLVDSATGAQDAARLFAASDLDLILCYVGTYATSSQVLPVVQRAKLPVLVLNLQPVQALDYENVDTGEWLANCSTCCVPEISNAFARARVQFRVVSGTLRDDPEAWGAIEEWCLAARAAAALRSSRIGFLGHTYPGMLDMYSDFTMVSAQTGAHIEILEMCDLDRCVREAAAEEVADKSRVAREMFTLENVSEGDLEWAARVAAGLDRLVAGFSLNGLTYYYRGLDGNPYERLGAGVILGNSLLTARGIPASGEGDLKTCLAMMILDRLGAGGSFTEFYAMDFRENFVLMGHDGPGHLAITDRKPVLRGLVLYHGKRGSGVSVEFNVKTGPVTLLAMTQTAEGSLKMITAQGVSEPGPTMRIGNTNSRLRFPLGPREFVNRWCAEGPTHHCALGVGHVERTIAKLGELLQIPVVSVC